MENNQIEIKEYLSNIKCNGCYNKCYLSSPRCGKSKIFIKDALEKYNSKKTDQLV